MTLPEHFDQNEWFVLTGVILSYLLVYLLPRRFPISVMILVMLFAIVCARFLDHMMAAPSIDLYDIMDKGSYELFDLVLYSFYAPFAYLYIFLFDKFKIKGIWTGLYILIWSLIAIGFERVNMYLGVFHYHGWKVAYSFPVYLAVQSLTLLFFLYIQHHYNHLKSKQKES
ncbi:hypothetical protein GWK91_05350 [Virgibacillus sp. MSP4-1]|uniref:hypothetical protein n=1 Tax=Virgibacillus sp. MSP4-1 TaxID=2700081 RepID=UPI0003AB1356|nr:hypothetical protein [Virgibacillus sp. MSP4-1]QHS22413.1 hypothetical protein GWK91_05350 [Virgibacillus sp. MSP4-1]